MVLTLRPGEPQGVLAFVVTQHLIQSIKAVNHTVNLPWLGLLEGGGPCLGVKQPAQRTRKEERRKPNWGNRQP